MFIKKKIQKGRLNNINVFYWTFISLLLYNSIILLRYKITGFWINDFQLYQFAFTYQDCGFITRGIIPSIVLALKLAPIPFLYILCNVFIVFYVLLIYHIINLYNIENRLFFLISFLFLFFGIPHFALDALRLDIILQVITMLVFVLLHQNKILITLFITIIGLLIHEGVYFLLIPMFFLKMQGRNKWIYSILLTAFFLFVVLMANKITKEQAIHLAATNVGMYNVAETYYIPQVSSAKDNVFHVFKTYKMQYALLYMLVYLIVLYKSFRNLFNKPIFEYRWLCLFPLFICLVAADWFRWICFVYFITMLYAVVYDCYDKKILKNFIILTIMLGIPIAIGIKYGVVPIIVHFFSKII
jgi:hypothetical protein